MSSPDDIRRQLAALRLTLRRDAREVAADARTLMDWRHHFRRHPWLCCGAAAAVGYVLVPRRARQPGLPTIATAMTAAPVEAQTAGQPSLAGNLMASALSMAGTAALRYSIAQLSARGRQYLDDYLKPTDAPHDEAQLRP